MKKRFTIILILVAGCISTAFVGGPDHASTSYAIRANQEMWDALHTGDYDAIPTVLEQLREAYYRNPGEATVTAHLGFVHLWAFSERARKPHGTDMLNHVQLSNRYFREAIALSPEDHRLLGFQSALEMCEGGLQKDVVKFYKGMRSGKKAIKKYPQFNRFAMSYVQQQGPRRSPMFRRSVNWQWEIIDECSCNEFSREELMKDPEKVLVALVAEFAAEEDERVRRACWNSWIAPHNFEGFSLNLGDMLVKDGDLEAAGIIYNAAKLAPGYSEWPYRDVLEDRLKNMAANKEIFNRKLELLNPQGPQMFINSEFSCSACHQMSPAEFAEMGRQYPAAAIVSR